MINTLDKNTIEKIIKLRNKGFSIYKIESKLGIVRGLIERSVTKGLIPKIKNPTKFRLLKDLSKEEIEEIKKLYKKGWLNREISKKFFVSIGTVRKIRFNAGIQSNFLRPVSEKQLKRIIKLYVRYKVGIAGIARMLGMSSDTVTKCLRDHNIKFRDRKTQNRIIADRKIGRMAVPKGYYDNTGFCANDFIWDLTDLMWKCYKNFEYRGYKRSLHLQLDHKFSRADAVKFYHKTKDDRILWMVSHPANFQLLSLKQNEEKAKTSSITLKQLKKDIIDWNNRYLRGQDAFEYVMACFGFFGGPPTVFKRRHKNIDSFKNFIDKYGYDLEYWKCVA